jgi:hypothetical protein
MIEGPLTGPISAPVIEQANEDTNRTSNLNALSPRIKNANPLSIIVNVDSSPGKGNKQ